ncbi:hypothetical protein [Phenylobacterium sp.]|uniref:hypothetical protein n=1 Tax=Phenylobacterium sp. TaxID=1871053 RepID=UPI00286BBD82|nr:hypothetical protein [Phenylobacterium sp.]
MGYDLVMATLPILIRGTSMGALQPLSLASKSSTNLDGYDERWLQDLIQSHPEVLPTAELEPGFGRLLPVSKEVACGHGYIDNLFVTAEGGIAIVETKLWRNLEARRLVVAQALDYAAALARMSYDEFERAALAGDMPGPKPVSLHSLIAESADALDEPAFIQAVSLNLKRGRMLVIAAGDGVRAEAEALADLLQSHAGARFTFALVAIELFKAEDGAVLAVPRAVAKTVLIERGVVRIADDRVVIEPPARGLTSGTAIRSSLTEDQFMEEMAKRDQRLPAAIRSFLDRIADFGVEPEWKASLNLKWIGGANGPVNFGYIRKDGGVATDMTSYKLGPLAMPYQQDLASMVRGKVVQRSENSYPFIAGADGRSSVKVEQLLPNHAEEWADAMDRLIKQVQRSEATE